MSQARELLKKIATDPELAQRLENAADVSAKQQILTEIGFGDLTQADVEAAVQEVTSQGSADGELSEEDLEAVAGGRTVEWVTAVSVVAGAAAAAAT